MIKIDSVFVRRLPAYQLKDDSGKTTRAVYVYVVTLIIHVRRPAKEALNNIDSAANSIRIFPATYCKVSPQPPIDSV